MLAVVGGDALLHAEMGDASTLAPDLEALGHPRHAGTKDDVVAVHNNAALHALHTASLVVLGALEAEVALALHSLLGHLLELGNADGVLVLDGEVVALRHVADENADGPVLLEESAAHLAHALALGAHSGAGAHELVPPNGTLLRRKEAPGLEPLGVLGTALAHSLHQALVELGAHLPLTGGTAAGSTKGCLTATTPDELLGILLGGEEILLLLEVLAASELTLGVLLGNHGAVLLGVSEDGLELGHGHALHALPGVVQDGLGEALTLQHLPVHFLDGLDAVGRSLGGLDTLDILVRCLDTLGELLVRIASHAMTDQALEGFLLLIAVALEKRVEELAHAVAALTLTVGAGALDQAGQTGDDGGVIAHHGTTLLDHGAGDCANTQQLLRHLLHKRDTLESVCTLVRGAAGSRRGLGFLLGGLLGLAVELVLRSKLGGGGVGLRLLGDSLGSLGSGLGLGGLCLSSSLGGLLLLLGFGIALLLPSRLGSDLGVDTLEVVQGSLLLFTPRSLDLGSGPLGLGNGRLKVLLGLLSELVLRILQVGQEAGPHHLEDRQLAVNDINLLTSHLVVGGNKFGHLGVLASGQLALLHGCMIQGLSNVTGLFLRCELLFEVLHKLREPEDFLLVGLFLLIHLLALLDTFREHLLDHAAECHRLNVDTALVKGRRHFCLVLIRGCVQKGHERLDFLQVGSLLLAAADIVKLVNESKQLLEQLVLTVQGCPDHSVRLQILLLDSQSDHKLLPVFGELLLDSVVLTDRKVQLALLHAGICANLLFVQRNASQFGVLLPLLLQETSLLLLDFLNQFIDLREDSTKARRVLEVEPCKFGLARLTKRFQVRKKIGIGRMDSDRDHKQSRQYT
mmetsp:Transcript_4856/g.11340  ORF Transcript_4856/g.11340 Transcript_4856/m.11340 type:complete len:857 (+) Transcript_4856:1852-4422(+)